MILSMFVHYPIMGYNEEFNKSFLLIYRENVWKLDR